MHKDYTKRNDRYTYKFARFDYFLVVVEVASFVGNPVNAFFLETPSTFKVVWYMPLITLLDYFSAKIYAIGEKKLFRIKVTVVFQIKTAVLYCVKKKDLFWIIFLKGVLEDYIYMGKSLETSRLSPFI